MGDPPVIDAVVIGRNEGARLVACLDSLAGQVRRIVYVDSGSTDNSVADAQMRGATVTTLDADLPFTAARARNAGLAVIANADFVQFVDGDCAVQPGWISKAAEFLTENEQVAVVCGRRRERFPEASIYNAMADREWDTPVGQTKACGGDALMRIVPLRALGGFRDDLIAGEEPDLCLRLRQTGWQIWRLDAEMTLHDAAMTRFAQWWRRTRRAGFAFAQGAYLHGSGPERHWVRETRRAVAWGVFLPVCAILGTLIWPPAAWILLAYPAQILRLGLHEDGTTSRWQYPLFNVLGKLAEATGVVQFHLTRLRGGQARLIEYK